MPPAFLCKENAMKFDKTKLLKLILLILILALVAVAGHILWQEYQYGVSDEYYDSLRNTGLMKGGWRL